MRPSLEEVREHFKDALAIRKFTNLKAKYDSRMVYETAHSFLMREADNDVGLWNGVEGYAEIVTRRTPVGKEKPSLEDVKEHFKDALEIRDTNGGKVEYDSRRVFSLVNAYTMREPNYNIMLWNAIDGFAEILTYKTAKSDKAMVEFFDPKATKSEVFDAVIENTIESLEELLLVKGKEYRRNDNPFHNFEEGAKLTGETREEVLRGFRLKHEISVADMREDLKEGKLPSRDKVNEKYDDILLYYLIEKASMIDRIDNQ